MPQPISIFNKSDRKTRILAEFFFSKVCKTTFLHNFLELELAIFSKAFGKEHKPFISYCNALNGTLKKDKKGSV